MLSPLSLMPHSFHDFGTDIQGSESLETAFFFYQDRKTFFFFFFFTTCSCNAHRKVVICLLLIWNYLLSYNIT